MRTGCSERLYLIGDFSNFKNHFGFNTLILIREFYNLITFLKFLIEYYYDKPHIKIFALHGTRRKIKKLCPKFEDQESHKFCKSCY